MQTTDQTRKDLEHIFETLDTRIHELENGLQFGLTEQASASAQEVATLKALRSTTEAALAT